LISIAVTFAIAMVSLVWNATIQKQATQTSNVLETTRVENGEVLSNSNAGDFHSPWRQWGHAVSHMTMYIGIERDVKFERPFRINPEVTLGLSLIDRAPMDLVLSRIGFQQKDPMMSERLRHIHVVSQVGGVTKDHFIVQLGVGLPTEAATVLLGSIERAVDTKANKVLLDNMRLYGQLENRVDPDLSPGEIWLINFYKTVGSFKITWIAQASEGPSGVASR
jgi:hypothetical protein